MTRRTAPKPNEAPPRGDPVLLALRKRHQERLARRLGILPPKAAPPKPIPPIFPVKLPEPIPIKTELSADGRTVAVEIPLTFRQRGGRVRIVAPKRQRASWAPIRNEPNNSLVQALGRAHRWQRLLESGKFRTITQLAAAEGINKSYLCRMLRLTLLSPAIVEQILAAAPGTIDRRIKDYFEAKPLWAEQQGLD